MMSFSTIVVLDLHDKIGPALAIPAMFAMTLALGALMVRVAMSDHSYKFAEVHRIDLLLGRLFGLGPIEAAKMRAQCERLEHVLPRTADLTAILTENISQEKREAAVAALWDVVYADGNRHAKENMLLDEIAGLLGVDEATCERIRDEEVANWHKYH